VTGLHAQLPCCGGWLYLGLLLLLLLPGRGPVRVLLQQPA
jgi:hypothetical protein